MFCACQSSAVLDFPLSSVVSTDVNEDKRHQIGKHQSRCAESLQGDLVSIQKIKKNVVITSSNKRSEENECVPSNLDPAQFEIKEYTSDSGGIFIRLSGCRKNEPCQGMSTYHRKSSAGYGSGDREEILEVGASGAQAKSNNSTRTVRISECSTVKGAEEAHSIVQDVANLYDKVLPLYLKVKRKERLAASTLIHIKKNKQVSITGSVTD